MEKSADASAPLLPQTQDGTPESAEDDGSRKSARQKRSRKLSLIAKELVTSEIGSTYGEGAAVLFALNMVLGTGPLTLPYAFAQAGFGLSAVFLAVCAVLGYITATYVIETLVLGNAILFEQAEVLFLQSQQGTGESPGALSKQLRTERAAKVFKIRERIELGQMGDRMLPRVCVGILYLCLFSYTFGCLCVYAVSITATMAALWPAVGAAPDPVGVGVSGHTLFVGLFAALAFPLCCADMQRLRSLQAVILVARALAIVGMIACATVDLEEAEEPAEMPPMVQTAGLPSLFGNAVLSFMVHHSLPGLLAPLSEQEAAPRVIQKAYGIGYVVYLIIGWTALSAFGAGVDPLYNLNFQSFPVAVVGKSLAAYPLLIFAIYPIVAITLRNNLVLALGLPPGDKRISALGTAAVVFLPAIVAIFFKDVQVIVSVFAGYFGLTLMLLWPCILVTRARLLLNLEDSVDVGLRSRWGNLAVRVLVCSCWAGALVFNTYRLFFAA